MSSTEIVAFWIQSSDHVIHLFKIPLDFIAAMTKCKFLPWSTGPIDSAFQIHLIWSHLLGIIHSVFLPCCFSFSSSSVHLYNCLRTFAFVVLFTWNAYSHLSLHSEFSSSSSPIQRDISQVNPYCIQFSLLSKIILVCFVISILFLNDLYSHKVCKIIHSYPL